MKRLFALATLFSLILINRASADSPPALPTLIGDIIVVDDASVWNVGGISVAYNSTDDEFRVFWFDSRIEDQNDVYSQRLSTLGELLGANLTICAGIPSYSTTACAYDPIANQYFFVCRYQNGGPGTEGFNHAYGGLVSARGGLINGLTDVCNGGLEPTLAYNSVDQQFFLEARNFYGGGAEGIRGQRFDRDGNVIGGGVTITNTDWPAPCGQVCYNSNANQYLATWREQSNENLQGRIINADGTFATSAFVISTMFPESVLAASAAFDPVNDRYLVLWSGFYGGGAYGQFLSLTGAPVGGPFMVFEPDGYRLKTFVAYDPVNRVYLAAWQDLLDVWVQLLSDSGELLGDPINLGGYPDGSPRVAVNTTSGGFLVVWWDRTYVDNNNVLAQLVGVEPEFMIGDVNCDGVINNFDINPFVLALTNPAGYAAQYPGCDIMLADTSGDGVVNNFDISPFVGLLTAP
ncbi:MAG: hypothetical protein PVJ57_03805 [Phycisphaerae bacterium]|jgi:hypothetical protein